MGAARHGRGRGRRVRDVHAAARLAHDGRVSSRGAHARPSARQGPLKYSLIPCCDPTQAREDGHAFSSTVYVMRLEHAEGASDEDD